MIKTVQFEGHSVEINTSAGWLFVYRRQFGRDILPDIMPVIESILAAVAELLEDSKTNEISLKEIAEATQTGVLVDAFTKLAGMELMTMYQVFYAMAKNADKGIQPPEEYFNSFDIFPLDIILPEMFASIVESSISSKNSKSLLEMIRKRTRSTSIGSSSQPSTEG